MKNVEQTAIKLLADTMMAMRKTKNQFVYQDNRSKFMGQCEMLMLLTGMERNQIIDMVTNYVYENYSNKAA